LDLSIVVPAFNEEEGISSFVYSLQRVLDTLELELEVIVVNDGSKDKTLEKLLDISWPQLKILDLVANSGHMAALEAGLKISKGKIVITLDADQQHPVECIPEMMRIQSASKCDVVVGVRVRGKEEVWLRRKLSTQFYKILSRLSNVKIEENAADFRLITREALEEILKSPEINKVFRFLISDYGYKIQTFNFIANKRKFGKSKYRISNLVKLAIQSLVGFSTTPLSAIFISGFVFLTVGILYAAFLVVSYLNQSLAPGWTSIMLFLTIFSSLQFLAIGILGFYVAEILKGIRRRPNYIVRTLYTADKKIDRGKENF